MLQTHLSNQERLLLELYRISAIAGHSLNIGTPREAFVKVFLENHLSERVAIGCGEIIDCNSLPGDSRNQIDVVIYKRDYPRLTLGGGINAFLAESVVATIEVKSTLDYDAVRQSTGCARRVKSLERNVVKAFHAGYEPPSVLSFVVAYRGPAKMETVHEWIRKAAADETVQYPPLPATADERQMIASPGLDAVFVLGTGFVHFGNFPVGFFRDEVIAQCAEAKWAIADDEDGSLLLLFLMLTTAVSGIAGSWLQPGPYVKNFSTSGLRFGN